MTTINFTTEQLLNNIAKEVGITQMILGYVSDLDLKEKMNKICKEINSIDYRIFIGCGGLMMSQRTYPHRWVQCKNIRNDFDVVTSDEKCLTICHYEIDIDDDKYIFYIEDYPELDLPNNPYYITEEDDDEEMFIQKRRYYVI